MEIKFEQVNYTYNLRTPLAKKVLNDISLIIPANKINGIVGPVGSGKTTMMELINGLIFPTRGIVTVGNYTIKKAIKGKQLNKLRFDVGIVFQFPEEQFFNITVKEEIIFALQHYQYHLKEIDDRINKALQMVGLNETFLDRNPFNLSGGEKRKVAIASILVFNPKVIILDEPTVGLDYNSKKKLIQLIKKLRKNYHKTIIICTHDVDMLYQIADNIIVINKGNIIIDGPKEEVFSKEELLKANGVGLPKILTFVNKARNNKGINLVNCTDIKDLIKDVYRNV
jgi:energy-coupling factor transport system ATP-binding protein